jgi:large subunit ribosomal protein L35
MKTRRGAAKRLRLTGGGKIRRHKAKASHLMTNKTRKQKRRLRQAGLVHPADQKRMLKLLGKG